MPNLHIFSAVASLAVLAACAGSGVGPKPDAKTTLVSEKNAMCLKDTGSRISGVVAGCSAFGRSYSSQEIRSTGSTTASEALRLLDPSITVH
jgi:hypothetical protein